jgi:pyrroloquinoline quinone (PQQ) biosynthesis protein C
MTLYERFANITEQINNLAKHNREINKVTLQFFMDSAEAKFTKPEEFEEFLTLIHKPFRN